jgi:hypothetical protein
MKSTHNLSVFFFKRIFLALCTHEAEYQKSTPRRHSHTVDYNNSKTRFFLGNKNKFPHRIASQSEEKEENEPFFFKVVTAHTDKNLLFKGCCLICRKVSFLLDDGTAVLMCSRKWPEVEEEKPETHQLLVLHPLNETLEMQATFLKADKEERSKKKKRGS